MCVGLISDVTKYTIMQVTIIMHTLGCCLANMHQENSI